jgi:adenylylsulfate kinase-like enzyme
MNTPLEVCEQRDVKGLYKKARNGEIRNFTGVDSKYEAPENPDVVIDSSTTATEETVDRVISTIL